MAYWRKYGVDGRLIRIFNTYGERMDPEDGRAVVNFATQALRGQPLTIYGDGSQTRSLCHVSDLVRGIIAVMEGDGLGGEVFNLGNPDERTMLDLARAVLDACGVELPFDYRADAGRRPDAALPRHRQGAARPRLAADGQTGGGLAAPDRRIPAGTGQPGPCRQLASAPGTASIPAPRRSRARSSSSPPR